MNYIHIIYIYIYIYIYITAILKHLKLIHIIAIGSRKHIGGHFQLKLNNFLLFTNS